MGYISVANMGLTWTTVTWSVSKPTEFDKITQNNGHYAVQVNSRSPILVPIESPYAAGQ